MNDAAPRLFCFGLGYSAMALVRRALKEGWRVGGTCRDPGKVAALAEMGVAAVAWDGNRPFDTAALDGATHVLTSVPPSADGDPVLASAGAALADLPGLAWVGYLSTTAVYGDRGGAWVDEAASLQPTLERAWRRVEAETGWLDVHRQAGVPVHIFRLAGIYGPGRSAIDSARTGRAHRIVKPGQVFSRIHVDDIAQVLLASMARPNPGAVYNVCDDDPAPPQDVMLYACQLVGIDPPPEVPFEEAQLSPMAQTFYQDNKRVRNDRIKDELGVELLYPDYRSGLEAVLQAERDLLYDS